MTEETSLISPEMPKAQRSKRGFTLTEIAIVLGIIGLILGAIWVAAAAVYQNMRVSKANTEVLAIVQAVRAMYSTSNVVDANANMAAAFGASTVGNANHTYISAGVFPTDMLNTGNPQTATTVSNPWQGGVAVVAATDVIANDSFAVHLNDVPDSGCVALITAITGIGRDPGLFSVNAGAAGAFHAPANGTNTPPITASAANTLCNRATTSIGFGFTVK